MRGTRRWTAAVAVALMAGVLAPAGNGTAEAQTPPETSDEIEVTYLTDSDGGPFLGATAITSSGEVLGFSLAAVIPLPTNYAVWKDGEVTPIAREGEWWRVTGFSDRGEVIGELEDYESISGDDDDANEKSVSWLKGETTVLPKGGAYDGTPYAVNDHGKIAGRLIFWDPPADPYSSLVVWHGEEIITAPIDDDATGRVTSVVGINNRSQVAIDVIPSDLLPLPDPSNPEFDTRAAVWNVGGDVVDLGTLGGDTSEAVALNDRGMDIGNSTTTDGEDHAFLWYDGEMVDLGTLGGDTSEAVALNEWGQVIGTSTDADGEEHGFLWYDGEMTRIEGLDEATGTQTSQPYALNNWGQVVGRSSGQAFLWQNGQIVNLSELADLGSSRAVDINDRGQIVGTETTSSGWAPRSVSVMWTVSPLWGYPDGL